MKLHVLMACHNRRELTLRCLSHLEAAAKHGGVDITIHVLDDGSTDGTSAAIQKRFPNVRTLSGDGSYFWARSMRAVEIDALSIASDDSWLMWLNDDVTLDTDAFQRFEVASRTTSGLLVGSTRDADTGAVTYAGFARSGLHPLSFGQVHPSGKLQPIEAFNGNIVFVPVLAARRIGGIDGEFTHAFADIDYGLRANSLHISVDLLPGTVGSCSRNPPLPDLPILADWRRFVGPKGGGNLRSTRRLLKRNHPRIWWLAICATQVSRWARRLLKPITRVPPALRRSGGS